MSDVFDLLHSMVQNEKLYLQRKLRVAFLCGRLQQSPRALNAMLKNRGFQNIAHFINHFRVKDAAVMLSSREYDLYTIEAIAEMAGFANRQNFYNAFERIVGVRPAVYRASKRRATDNG